MNETCPHGHGPNDAGRVTVMLHGLTSCCAAPADELCACCGREVTAVFVASEWTIDAAA